MIVFERAVLVAEKIAEIFSYMHVRGNDEVDCDGLGFVRTYSQNEYGIVTAMHIYSYAVVVNVEFQYEVHDYQSCLDPDGDMMLHYETNVAYRLYDGMKLPREITYPMTDEMYFQLSTVYEIPENNLINRLHDTKDMLYNRFQVKSMTIRFNSYIDSYNNTVRFDLLDLLDAVIKQTKA